MATITFVFPEMNTPDGTALYFKIIREDTSGGTVNVNSLVWNLNPLNFQFETPGSATITRFANIVINVNNLNDDFENNSIYDETYDAETWIELYKNSSLFWTGRVVWDKSEKKEWYKENSTISYRYYELFCVDKIEALRSYTLADTGYAGGAINYYSLVSNIVGLVDLNSNMTENFKITETGGNFYTLASGVSGSTDTLKLKQYDETTDCLTFLKEFCTDFGLFCCTIGDTVYFTLRNNGVSSVALNDDNIIKIDQVNERNIYNYVEVKSIMDWEEKYVISDLGAAHEVNSTTGTLSNNSNLNLIIESQNLLNNTYISNDANNSTYPNTKKTPSSATSTSLTDGSVDFLGTDIVETGMVLDYNWDGIALFDDHSVVNNVNSNVINFYNTGVAVNTSKEYWVLRFPSMEGVYKVQKLCHVVKRIYDRFFMNETLRMEYIGYLNIYDIFTWNSKTYKPAEMIIDFVNYKTVLILHKINTSLQ